MSAATTCSPSVRITRSLLGYGVVAGPLYVGAVLVQAVLRPGFDLLHDDASLLANGSWGWVQVANFLVTGACVAAFAIGTARALSGRPGGVWAPRLLAVYAVGLVAAGIFVADPMNGFPAGAPAGHPEVISVHGILHIVSAAVGFIGLVAACFVMARRFATEKRQRWTAFSIVTGAVFLLGFGAIASGSSSAIVLVGFWAALLLSWSWMAAVAIDLYRRA
jgi:hypothetical protein